MTKTNKTCRNCSSFMVHEGACTCTYGGDFKEVSPLDSCDKYENMEDLHEMVMNDFKDLFAEEISAPGAPDIDMIAQVAFNMEKEERHRGIKDAKIVKFPK